MALSLETKRVLREALAIVARDHCRVQLAVDYRGRKCAPLAREAIAWSTVGALIKVAPNREPDGPSHTWPAWLAYLALQEQAERMGFLGTAAVDRAGQAEAVHMFRRALNADTERRAMGSRPRAGTRPRGAEHVETADPDHQARHLG